MKNNNNKHSRNSIGSGLFAGLLLWTALMVCVGNCSSVVHKPTAQASPTPTPAPVAISVVTTSSRMSDTETAAAAAPPVVKVKPRKTATPARTPVPEVSIPDEADDEITERLVEAIEAGSTSKARREKLRLLLEEYREDIY